MAQRSIAVSRGSSLEIEREVTLTIPRKNALIAASAIELRNQKVATSSVPHNNRLIATRGVYENYSFPAHRMNRYSLEVQVAAATISKTHH